MNETINKLIIAPQEQLNPFLTITPEIMSALVPKIRLFKVFKMKEISFMRHKTTRSLRPSKK